MTHPLPIRFAPTDPAALAAFAGRIALIVPETAGAEGARLAAEARTINRATRGALARFLASDAFAKLKAGEAADLAWPAGLAAEAVQVVKLPARTDALTARKAGGAIGARLGKAGVVVLAGAHRRAADVSLGLALRAYDFTTHKSAPAEARGPVTLMAAAPEAVAAAAAPLAALAEGVTFTRDLVNEPANVLTTWDFAARLAAMQDLGLDVEILDEEDLTRLGMRALLGVGQGSESPSKVVVMQWHGGPRGEAPFALVGKGVVFDTGGISIKPAQDMWRMKYDMTGAASVSGAVLALAKRGAAVNAVAIAALAENMPSGTATRPGDVIRTISGQTFEIMSTDAEGRMVLVDAIAWAQRELKPRLLIDIATLTGSQVTALGDEYAGLFSRHDELAAQLQAAGAASGEEVWRLPLHPSYAKDLESPIADLRNGGSSARAGAGVGAFFIGAWVAPELPWAHLDIASMAWRDDPALPTVPLGASGYGVRLLDRFVRDHIESGQR